MRELSIKDKLEMLKKTTIFSQLKDEELLIITENSEIVNYNENELIYNAGSNSCSLYIIVEGEILINKINADSQKIDLARFISGECFGELDLFNDIKHDTSAVALKNTSLIIFPKNGLLFKDLLKMHPAISAQILHKFLILIANRVRNTNKLISEKTPWIEDLKKQLHRDKLTGLYNKAYIDDEFNLILEKDINELCLLVLKPDNFKEINDIYGHEKGDLSLKFLASQISTMLDPDSIFARYKGDEYLVILKNTTVESAEEISGNLCGKISEMNIKKITDANDFYIKLSIGISSIKISNRTGKDLLDAAYSNMFKARNSGGNKFVSCR